jgi:hypothetical protein
LMRTRYPGHQRPIMDFHDDQNNLVLGEWRRGRQLDPLQRAPGNRDSLLAKRQRDMLRDYYASPHGAVPWQERMLRPYHAAAPLQVHDPPMDE